MQIFVVERLRRECRRHRNQENRDSKKISAGVSVILHDGNGKAWATARQAADCGQTLAFRWKSGRMQGLKEIVKRQTIVV